MNRNVCLFTKRQEKDVWHALLSFQGTGSRGSPPRRMPFRRHRFFQTRSEDRTFSIFPNRPSVKVFSRPEPENLDGSRQNDPWKDRNPCGDAQYRAALDSCQEKSKKGEKVNKDGPFRLLSLHRELCSFPLPSAALAIHAQDSRERVQPIARGPGPVASLEPG